jgi:8-amino-7-oxononanoate synthase
VLVVDGYCPDCGEPAPVDAMNAIAHQRDGWLVCDDTQALGVFGARPTPRWPYGFGGAGVLAFTGTTPGRTLLVTSLAKAFGAPVAALTGPLPAVRWFEERSQTRLHCSPPSAAVVAAAQHALDVNEQRGDTLRAALASNVRRFRTTLAAAGVMTATPSLFPIQSVGPFDRSDALAIQRHLAQRGVRAVLRRGKCRRGAFLSFIVTSHHTGPQVEAAARIVAATERVLGSSEIARELSHDL